MTSKNHTVCFYLNNEQATNENEKIEITIQELSDTLIRVIQINGKNGALQNNAELLRRKVNEALHTNQETYLKFQKYDTVKLQVVESVHSKGADAVYFSPGPGATVNNFVFNDLGEIEEFEAVDPSLAFQNNPL